MNEQPTYKKLPAFYITQTLLGGSPDVNRRALHFEIEWLSPKAIVFNSEMNEFDPEDNDKLHKACVVLSEMYVKYNGRCV